MTEQKKQFSADTYRGVSLDMIRAHRITHIDNAPIPANVIHKANEHPWCECSAYCPQSSSKGGQ